MDKGTRLRQLREAKNVSQVEASQFLGLTKQTLYKYEKNIVTNIPSDVVERMAKYYNTTPAYIMGWGSAEYPTDTTYKEAKEIYDKYKTLSPEKQALVRSLLESL